MATEFQYDVFLSHNSADKPRVRRLAERLRAAALRHSNSGLRISEFGFPPQAVLSPAAVGSDRLEVARPATASRRRRKRSTVRRGNLPFRDPPNTGRRFILLLVAGCQLPDSLRRYKWPLIPEQNQREQWPRADQKLRNTLLSLTANRLEKDRLKDQVGLTGRSPSFLQGRDTANYQST